MSYKREEYVNEFITEKLKKLNLKLGVDFKLETDMPGYMKESLKGRAKTERKTNAGVPDFNISKYNIPVIIESKLGIKKLVSETKEEIKFDDSSIKNYAVNGALYYAIGMIGSGKYSEVIAIGVAGDDESNTEIKVYYVYGFGEKSFKILDDVKTLNFLENEETFKEFYNKATLTEEEKHEILIKSKDELKKQAKTLNRLMHALNITAPQRVLYISGMLLAMQDIEKDGKRLKDGLIPNDLKGIQTESSRDGILITNQIKEFLEARDIPKEKQKLMLASFLEISKDTDRDEEQMLEKEVSKLLSSNASTNKQIFTFIYYNIFLSIDEKAGHLDIMGEMYSEFLKYALGDGKEIGIVLTPPYITKMMVQILDINKASRVMDLATGSAGFLISAMQLMIEDTEITYGKKTTIAEEKIKKIKKEQLLGIELNAEMFTLASTNMILRGDGSSNISKGNAFDRPEKLYEDFKANKILLNPPFSFNENGMPFIAFGLDKMEKGGVGAIIIQDSAGSGRAIKTNKEILKKHTLLASIKMPIDLFVPSAGVQTSIYIFEAWKPHDYNRIVKFIDFRNDGYKRTSRGIQEVHNPIKRYSDIIKIYKAGKNAKVEADWDLDNIYIEDFITDEGNDWNFEKHQKTDTTPTLEDFKKTVSDYLSWEVSNLLKNGDEEGKQIPYLMKC